MTWIQAETLHRLYDVLCCTLFNCSNWDFSELSNLPFYNFKWPLHPLMFLFNIFYGVPHLATFIIFFNIIASFAYIPSGIWRQDSNPQPLGCKSSSLTTRWRLLANQICIFINSNDLCFSLVLLNKQISEENRILVFVFLQLSFHFEMSMKKSAKSIACLSKFAQYNLRQ